MSGTQVPERFAWEFRRRLPPTGNVNGAAGESMEKASTVVLLLQRGAGRLQFQRLLELDGANDAGNRHLSDRQHPVLARDR